MPSSPAVLASQPPALSSPATSLSSRRAPRTTPTPAEPMVSHDEWFASDRRTQLKRGTETRKRFMDLLRASGRLLEPDNLECPSKALLKAILLARKQGKAIYISPGLIEAPDLSGEYQKRGWIRPGVKWANFKPALLKVEHLGPKKKSYWSLTVIGIKSTQPTSVPGQVRPSPSLSRTWRAHNPLSPFDPILYQQEEFQLLAYRFFLYRILQRLQTQAFENGQHLLERLSVARTCTMWRYSGCFAHACYDSECYLRTHPTAEELEQQVQATTVHNDQTWLEDVLFDRVPAELQLQRTKGLTRPPTSSIDALTAGWNGISLATFRPEGKTYYSMGARFV
ncbi:hypothetical protein JCM11641_005825 [Rhodosporidiobolus odoratus]